MALGGFGRTALKWGRLREEIKNRDVVIKAQAETLREKTIELYRVRAELNRLRNHHDRLHPQGDR